MEKNRLLCHSGSVEIHIGPPVDVETWVGREEQLLDHMRSEVRRLAGTSAARDADYVPTAKLNLRTD